MKNSFAPFHFISYKNLSFYIVKPSQKVYFLRISTLHEKRYKCYRFSCLYYNTFYLKCPRNFLKNEKNQEKVIFSKSILFDKFFSYDLPTFQRFSTVLYKLLIQNSKHIRNILSLIYIILDIFSNSAHIVLY